MMLPQFLLALVLACCALAPSARAALVDDPEQREPKPNAPESKVFAWTSKGDLRYTWVLPPGYDAKTPRNLTVILHGTGLDYRWGHWNHPVGVFRPNDVVVSVDGTSPGQGDSRLFLGEPKDAQAFKAFLDELRATFAVDRVYLYGHSQGGFFVTYYAGEFPDTVSGVVAHASGSWTWAKFAPGLKKVAIAYLHGSSDPVVPYGQSPGSRDVYAEKGYELLHLNRLDRYNHWPNAVRATETLDWCQGMTAKSPEEALDCAKRILAVKPPDSVQWETLVDFAGARDVLRRLEGQRVRADEGRAVLRRRRGEEVERRDREARRRARRRGQEDAAEEGARARRQAVARPPRAAARELPRRRLRRGVPQGARVRQEGRSAGEGLDRDVERVVEREGGGEDRAGGARGSDEGIPARHVPERLQRAHGVAAQGQAPRQARLRRLRRVVEGLERRPETVRGRLAHLERAEARAGWEVTELLAARRP
ncbi:MAG: alpha/beta fold hydrolase [Planctomycetes bacterium]|nr:alpha/beta fold hydrolase [Planctomycetota bacterium]